jgi:hypothetical protein
LIRQSMLRCGSLGRSCLPQRYQSPMLSMDARVVPAHDE